MKELIFETTKNHEVIDITEDIRNVLKESRVETGLLTVYVHHATAAIIVNENHDPNICDDFLELLDKTIPQGIWRHDKIDNNGAAHIKASILGPSESIPVKNNELQLGTWQSIMLVDLDGPRTRKVTVHISN